ncbi:MAG: GNAT family N-acetyltransferase [Planctomycetes bacterium]|nr:GNAT family N-acetyltransferase [Planctomycetota bacterium]
MARSPKLRVVPLTQERWDDFERLFGPRGACGGCWCMTPRLTSAQYAQRKGAGNRRAMRALVERGPAPGLLAYRGKEPVGWCALAPREEYVRYARSRVAKPLDARPAWMIACLFVRPDERGKGVSEALVRAAIAHAKKHGGERIEAFPVEPRAGQELVPVFAWTGIASTFTRAGFEEVARRTPTRPYLRRELGT